MWFIIGKDKKGLTAEGRYAVKPFTNKEILLNYERIIGRTDFNKYFTESNLITAEIIKAMIENK
jgi:hypothetical protein